MDNPAEEELAYVYIYIYIHHRYVYRFYICNHVMPDQIIPLSGAYTMLSANLRLPQEVTGRLFGDLDALWPSAGEAGTAGLKATMLGLGLRV